jgi:hypothetical protein
MRFPATIERILSMFQKSQRERELHDEFSSHLQLHIDDNPLRGLSPHEARRQALLRLGCVGQTRERVRDALLLALAVLSACYALGRRASRVGPIIALR